MLEELGAKMEALEAEGKEDTPEYRELQKQYEEGALPLFIL